MYGKKKKKSPGKGMKSSGRSSMDRRGIHGHDKGGKGGGFGGGMGGGKK